MQGRWFSRDPVASLPNDYGFATDDVLGLLTFGSECKKYKQNILSAVNSITNVLEKTIRDKTTLNGIRDILEKYHLQIPMAWHKLGKKNDYDEKRLQNALNRLLADIMGQNIKVECCSSAGANPCNDPRNKNTAAAYKYGKIYLCNESLQNTDTYGGFDCIIVHELIHRHGMNVYDKDDAATQLDKERATVRISELLLGKECPAPAYFP